MYLETFPHWAPAPDRPDLVRCQVDVWRIVPSGSAQRTGSSAAGGLPGHAGDAVREFARAALDDILGRYLRRPPGALELRVHPGGKPYLDAPAPGIEFNLSHCIDMALVAVTSGLAVGIDVEARRRVADPLRLARRVFTADEVALLVSLPATRRTEQFLDLWTRMEARQKAIGRGIFADPADPATMSNLTFRPGPDHWAGLSLSPRAPAPAFRFFDYCRT